MSKQETDKAAAEPNGQKVQNLEIEDLPVDEAHQDDVKGGLGKIEMPNLK